MVQRIYDKVKRTSINIFPRNESFIDDLCYEYKKRTGKKLSASEVIRAALDYFGSAMKKDEQIEFLIKNE